MKKTILKWWLQNLIVFICCLICSYFGVIKEIYQKDYSFLCFAIMFIYIASSVWNGFIAYKVDFHSYDKKTDLDVSWFMSELCLALGMIGTVIGFIGMLQGFGVISEGSKAIQKMMSEMSSGMATALYTTLAGLIFGNLIKVQCFDIEKSIDRNKNDV